MIANAEFGFPGEKVSFKRASLLDLRQRSLSTASTASSTSTVTSSVPVAAADQATTGTGMLLPVVAAAAVPDTSFTTADEVATTAIVPKMRGVNSVSDESKEL
ncbi:hypothetical protein BGZ54_003943, partial [Gamsiella multidivaricata]